MTATPENRFEQTVQRGAEEVARRVAAAGPRYASVDDTIDQSREWTNEQLVCRTKGHRFTVPIDAQYYDRYRYYFVRLGCEGQCGVIQEQEMNLHGHVNWSTLRYPKGYQSRHGRVVGDAKDAVRVEWVQRVIRPKRSRSGKNEPRHQFTED